MLRTEIECDRCHEPHKVNGQPTAQTLELQFGYKQIGEKLLCPACVKSLMDWLGMMPPRKRDAGFSDGRAIGDREVPSGSDAAKKGS